MKQNRNGLLRSLLVTIAGLYLGVALRTGRWRIDADPACWKLLTGQAGEAVIVVFWHEYLPVVPVLWWQARRENPALSLHALISRHRDGRLIARIMRRWQIQAVEGSSARAGKADKGGATALRTLIGLLRRGNVVALTPDGPRGPRRQMQPGVISLAALSGSAIVPVAARSRPLWRLRSWDRLMLPLPFGRGTILCGTPVTIGRYEGEAGFQRLTQAMQALDHAVEAP